MNQKIETPMTTEQKNEVIARFMGLEKSKNGNWIVGSVMGLPETRTSERIGYDSDFRTLMPACQKFCVECSKRGLLSEEISEIGDAVNAYLYYGSSILDIHQALFEGVQWLNTQTK